MKMPAGVAWGRYLVFQASALTSTFLGAQCVHLYYRPMDDLDKMIEEAKAERFGPAGEEQKTEKISQEKTEKIEPKETVPVVSKNTVSESDSSTKVKEEKN